MELTVDNVNEALSTALVNLSHVGLAEDSRNGPVLVFPEPVMTVYKLPAERVLFSAQRDANPFFHLMESLWMLAGRNDVEWITQYNSKFGQFSDDGKTFHGAYGHRWRYWFGYDQLRVLARELRKNHSTRRAVLAMWDGGLYPEHVASIGEETPRGDLYAADTGGKDVPCNTHIYFRIIDARLDLTVCCRSNDLWWGAYGANAVHFSMLQEVMAAWVGVEVGRLFQFSNNLHLYTNVVPESVEPNRLRELAMEVDSQNEYAEDSRIQPFPVVGRTQIEWWFQDLEQFMRNPFVGDRFTWRSAFFRDVAVPMAESWIVRKSKQGSGLEQADRIQATDWRKACMDWIQRRLEGKPVGQEQRSA